MTIVHYDIDRLVEMAHFKFDSSHSLEVSSGAFSVLYTDELSDFDKTALALKLARKKWTTVHTRVKALTDNRFLYPAPQVQGGGPSTCALCVLFLNYEGTECRDCPIAIFTGLNHCARTPYLAFYKRGATLEERISAAADEVALIEKLLARHLKGK